MFAIAGTGAPAAQGADPGQQAFPGADGIVVLSTAGLDGSKVEQTDRLADVALALLEAGHAVRLRSPDEDDPLLPHLTLRGPTRDGRTLLTVDPVEGWALEVGHPLDEGDQGQLRGRVGPPRARSDSAQAVAIGVSAWAPELERDLERQLALAVLEAGFVVAGHRQRPDVRVCIAVGKAEVRLSSARPSESCGRIQGRLPEPAKLDRATLGNTLARAAVKLAADAFPKVEVVDKNDQERADDDEVISEIFTAKPSDTLPFRLTSLGPQDFTWGWHLLVPTEVVATISAGALARLPRLDPVAQLEVRTVFPFGLSVGGSLWGTYAGPRQLCVLQGCASVSVVEASPMLVAAYEHAVAMGISVRAGVAVGGRLHLWSGAQPGLEDEGAGWLVDPVIGAVVALRYEFFSGLDVDVSVPLIYGPPRTHLAAPGKAWGRPGLGVGLLVGLGYHYDLGDLGTIWR